jgi:hypothetical protein
MSEFTTAAGEMPGEPGAGGRQEAKSQNQPVSSFATRISKAEEAVFLADQQSERSYGRAGSSLGRATRLIRQACKASR